MSTRRLPKPGADNGTWGTILNDFLEVSLTPDGTLNPNTVGQDQLQTASVGTTQLQAGAVTTTTIANNAVTSTQLASAIQTNLSLASSSVQSVNSQTPSGSGAVTLTASELGALSTTNNLSDVSSTSSALANLGGAKALIDSGSSITTSGTILHQASERVDATSGAITRTAPAIVTGPPWDNTFLVKKIDTSSNVITISYPNTAGTTSTETLIGTNQAKAFRQTSGLGYEVEVDSNPLSFDAYPASGNPIVLSQAGMTVFSVKAFGAKGDGVTDDTAAIQAAINACIGGNTYYAGRGYVYLPAGRYLVSATLVVQACWGFRIAGAGRWQTSLVPNTALSGLTVLLLEDCYEPIAEDFTILGNSSAPEYGIEMRVSAAPIVPNTGVCFNRMGFGSTYSNSLVYGWGWTTYGPDDNNDQAFINDPYVNNCTHAFYIGHSNSEMHKILGGELSTNSDIAVAAGGSFTIIGTSLFCGGYVARFNAGTYRHEIRLIGVYSEGASQYFYSDPAAVSLALVIVGSTLSGGAANTNLINLQSIDTSSYFESVSSTFNAGQPGTTINLVPHSSMRGGQLGTSNISFSSALVLRDVVMITTPTLTNNGTTQPILDNINLVGSTVGQDTITLTLQSPWVNVGSPYQSAQAWVDSNGIVHLEGVISSGTNGSLAFVLPSGLYRSGAGTYMPITITGSGAGYIKVDGSGNCSIYASSGTVTGNVILTGATIRPGWSGY